MKKKIYCLLSTHSYLDSSAGDKINELNTYRALSIYYDVYYNNRKLTFTGKDRFFGTDKKDKISLPDKKYDLYYVRSNPSIFNKLPNPKIYFCVPNHQDCFKQAKALVFPTKAWLNLLKNKKYKILTNIYKPEDYIPKNLIEFNQITHPEDLKKDSRTLHYRNLFGGDFIIGHFGRVVKSNYPYSFIKMLPELIANNPGKKITVIFSGNIKTALPKQIRVIKKISKDDIKYAISACDILLYNQDGQGQFAGSLKIIDAMSYGIPVITPKYIARVDELGEEYPLYCDDKDNRINKHSLLSKINYVLRNPGKVKKISSYMKKRAEYYTLNQTAIRYKKQLDKII